MNSTRAIEEKNRNQLKLRFARPGKIPHEVDACEMKGIPHEVDECDRSGIFEIDEILDLRNRIKFPDAKKSI